MFVIIKCLFFVLISLSSCSSQDKVDKIFADICVENDFLKKTEIILSKRRRTSRQSSVFDHLRKGCPVPKSLPKPEKIVQIPIVAGNSQLNPSKESAFSSPKRQVIKIPVVYPNPPSRIIIPLIIPDLSFTLFSGLPSHIGQFISNISSLEEFVNLYRRNVIPVHPSYLLIPKETSDCMQVSQTSNGSRALRFSFSYMLLSPKLSALSNFLKHHFEVQRSILAIVLERGNHGFYQGSILFKKSANISTINIRRLLSEALGENAEFIIWNDNIHL